MQFSTTSLLYKILVVFLLFCLSKASGGTCLSYGHSCWGGEYTELQKDKKRGHGKRSGAGNVMGPTNSQKRTSEWYISRLFNTPISNSQRITAFLKSQDKDNEEIDKFRRPYGYQMYPISDTVENNFKNGHLDSEGESESNKWKLDNSEPEDDIVLLTPEDQQPSLSKYQLFHIVREEGNKKRAAK